MTDLGYTWMLQYWTTDYENKGDANLFAIIFFSFILGSGIIASFKLFIILRSSNRLSRNLSMMMIFKMVHASVNDFFDRVPIGRILNRFMKDMNQIDWGLAMCLSSLMDIVISCLIDLAATVYTASPIMIVFIAIFAYISWRMQKFYLKSLRELTRLKAISTSPTIQAFSEGMQGGCTIRVYGRQEYILNEYMKAVDEFQKNMITGEGLGRWFGVRQALLSILVFVPSISLNLLFVKSGPGGFALLMRYLVLVIQDVSEFLGNAANQETKMVSFERCCYFANVPPEGGDKNLDILEKKFFANKNILTYPEDWPETGNLAIKDLKVKYRLNLDFVLKGLTFDIPHGSKVGIVGRTGAGKSTFISCLYRNFDQYEGKVELDGNELRDIDLKVLRQGITVIPQDPYLFQDTLRNNLDPIHQKTDAELEGILKEVGIWNKFERDGLKFKIDQSGSNLSQGEKQILCIARALLFHKKLILLDEATSNVDSHNEEIIQRILAERFVGCTIIMIAHRLNTVMACDKILVLSEGLMVEYDDRAKLMADPNSFFSKMLSKNSEIHSSLA